MTRMSRPQREALAYRIWAYCEPREWDCTVGEIADAMGVSWQAVSKAVKTKGWRNRLRSNYLNGIDLRHNRSLGACGLEALYDTPRMVVDA